MTVWELLAPRRPLTQNKPRRWFSNLGLAMLNNFVWRLVMPAGAVGLAMTVQSRGWGLFNVVSLPLFFRVIAAALLATFVVHAAAKLLRSPDTWHDLPL